LLDEAIASFREAIRINKDYSEAHNSLGVYLANALREKGSLGEAIAEYREAIRLNEAYYPEGQGFLGATLRENGQTEEAFAAFRKAVEGFAAAFAQPQMVNDPQKTFHRYNAACFAALAGCPPSKDADKLNAKELARFRKQALDWLRGDLDAWGRLLKKEPDKAGPAIAHEMQHWLKDNDFAGVRGPEAMARLPEAERKEWQKLWEEVEALRQRAAGKPAVASPTRP
jgi:tetratricopeptide (TPR) repeat protein